MKLTTFFNSKQQQSILDAIRKAEDITSGEIKVHIENHCDFELIERATDIFFTLQMHNTEQRNGVLIYIAIIDKKVAIIGDEGIDKVTPADYWETEVSSLIQYFKQSDFAYGIINTIHTIGEKLQEYFPIQENDINELSDEISFYDN